jgi:phenylacetaldehyde dehydrogenase
VTAQDVVDELRERPGTGDVTPIIDPATDEQIGEFTDGGAEAVDEAVAAKASAESRVWKGLANYDRAKVLWRAGDLIDQNADALAELEALNAGMPVAHANKLVSTSAEDFRYPGGRAWSK